MKKDKRQWEKVAPGLYKRHEGKTFIWYAWYSGADGKRKRKALPYCRSKRDAERERSRLVAEVSKAKERGYSPKYNSALTFKKLMKDHLEYAKQSIKSWKRHETSSKPLIEYFGDKKAASITGDDIDGYISWRLSTPKQRGGGKLKPGTVNRELALLRKAYNRAVRDRKLKYNPMSGVDMLQESPVKSIVLSGDEVQMLLEACPDRKEHPLRIILQLAFTLGLRRSEVAFLRWDQVNLKEKIITIEKTKNKTTKILPIPTSILAELVTMKRDQVNQVTDIKAMPFIFRFKSGQTYRHVGIARSAFKTACKRAGIKFGSVKDGFTFHGTRRTFATNMIDRGVSDHIIMQLGGWKTATMLKEYDGGRKMDQLRQAVEA